MSILSEMSILYHLRKLRMHSVDLEKSQEMHQTMFSEKGLLNSEYIASKIASITTPVPIYSIPM